MLFGYAIELTRLLSLNTIFVGVFTRDHGWRRAADLLIQIPVKFMPSPSAVGIVVSGAFGRLQSLRMVRFKPWLDQRGVKNPI